jgi:diguanylate cyclase (GGDEF)-like protein
MPWNRKSTFVVLNILVVLLFGGLLALTVGFVDTQRDTRLESRLQAASTGLANAVSEKLRTSVEDLRAVASLLTTLDDVDYATFSGFARRYIDQDQGLLILEWQPLVAEHERAAFVQRARDQGMTGFRLWEPDADGQPVRARERPLHVPVYFMLSRHEGTDTTGLDLAWSEQRMASKWAARDTGQPQSSGFFRVVTGRDSAYAPPGLAITLPIYQGGVIPATKVDRRGRLLGYLAGVFAVDTLLTGEIETFAAEGINIAITDGTGSELGVFTNSGTASKHRADVVLTLFGSDWQLQLTATRQLVDSIDDPLWNLLPALTALLGAMILVFLYLFEGKQLELIKAQGELSTALDRIKRSEANLRELSLRDPLTGLYNRRAFVEQLDHELERSARHGLDCTLLLLDLDHFKSINDTWGHPGGDRALEIFSALCSEASRSSDVVARIGGEEFAILLPDTDGEQALGIAERLRQRIADAELAIEGLPRPLTITASIGIATADTGMASAALITRADRALYRAKQSGRNRVAVYA